MSGRAAPRARARAPVLFGLAAVAAACGAELPPGWLYVTRVGSTTATVAWTGDGADGVRCRDAAGRVHAGAATRRQSGLRHATLENHRPDRPYACHLRRGDGRPGRRLHFRTAPERPAAFTFAAVGDTGDGSGAAAAIARRIRASRPRFLLHLGDLAYPELTPEALATRFFGPYRRLLARVPFYPTPGNHDLSRGDTYAEAFFPLYDPTDAPLHYGFDWAGTRILSASYADLASAAGTGRAWLAAALDDAASRPWRIVFLHQPAYTTSAKGTVPGLGRKLQQVLERGRTDLVLAGHAHMYERAAPACVFDAAARVLALVSGGGGDASLDRPRPHPNFPRALGAPHFLRVRVTADAIEAWAIGSGGQVLDHVRHLRGATAPCLRRGWWWRPPGWTSESE